MRESIIKDFINQIPVTKRLSYQERVVILRERKIAQTSQKVLWEGGLNEDDYGRVVPPEGFKWNIIPNHPNGSFYGYQGWAENFYDLMSKHPLYIDPLDAFSGKWMFFLSRMKGPIWPPEYDYSYLRSLFEKYNIICGIGSDAHFAPDYKIGLELGWGGLLEKLNHFKAIHGPEKHEFYDAEAKVIRGIQLWIRRTNDLIAELETVEQHPQLKKNLHDMYEVNVWVVDKPPRTLREVCQWICWFNMATRTYNRDGAGCQLDELLRPYYTRDITAGLIDEEEARFYIACLLLNETHYYQLGGPDRDGHDMTSHVSYLILEAADLINTSCNLTIRVHEGLDPQFFLKSVSYLFTNKNGWPRYSGDKALVEGFTRNGFPAELARERIAVGCNWMSLPGLEYTMNDLVKINTAKVFEVAYFEMIATCKNPSVTILWEYFSAHLRQAVEATAAGIAFHLQYQVHNEPELVLNLLSHGPVEKGLDVSNGGAQFYNIAIDGAGIAVVADSFAALEQRIEREARITWQQITDQLRNNFAGVEGEYIRQMMRSSEKYGQGASLGDEWGVKVSELFTDLVREENHHYDSIFIPGWFSWANTIDFGKTVGSTPNGRRAQEAVNHGANPLPGFRKDGAVTSLANIVAAIQPGYGNTAPIQLELDPSLGNDEESIKKIADFIRTVFEIGATLLNINILDKQKILEAHKVPSKYPDLVVRVTGFTAYFSMLSPEFRQLVVDRIIKS
jgi:pyruvate-formate lyase